MSKAIATERIERDGYSGTVYYNEERGTEFVAWELATFYSDTGQPVKVTGVTGRKGSPKAAAYNLLHVKGPHSFLANMLRSRIQWDKQGSLMSVSVPGAAIQGSGYDSPMSLTLRENLADATVLPLALQVLALSVVRVACKGVYAHLNKRDAEAGDEAEEEELSTIAF